MISENVEYLVEEYKKKEFMKDRNEAERTKQQRK